MIPYAAKHSQYVFTVSNHAKKDIEDHYNIDSKNVIVTYNAVNESYRIMSEKELDKNELYLKFGIKNDYILSVCNLQPRKNLVRLIQAYKKLKGEKGGQEQLVIVGKKHGCLTTS